jgi:hypothetical protein
MTAVLSWPSPQRQSGRGGQNKTYIVINPGRGEQLIRSGRPD